MKAVLRDRVISWLTLFIVFFFFFCNLLLFNFRSDLAYSKDNYLADQPS